MVNLKCPNRVIGIYIFYSLHFAEFVSNIFVYFNIVTRPPKAIKPVIILASSISQSSNSTGPQVAEPVKPLPTEVVTAVTATVVLVLLIFGVAAFWCRKWPNSIFKRRKKQSNTVRP